MRPGPYSESLQETLRDAVVAFLDAEHRVDPEATAAARQRLRALVDWASPDDPPRRYRMQLAAVQERSAARRMGLGGGSGTRGGEGGR